MCKLPSIVTLSLILGLPLASTASTGTPSRVKIDDDWRFSRFGELADGSKRVESPSMEQPAFDDSEWRHLDLPHDWGIEGPFRADLPGGTGKLPWAGIGWYRKTLDISKEDRGSEIYLDIDGAMSHSTIWLNGVKVGEWPYGYSSYRVRLTPQLRYGEKNTLAIRLDNPPDSSRWYPGGGLYRDVWLVKLAPVHFAHWGIFVKTPSISSEAAQVEVDAEIEHGGQAPKELKIRHEIFAPGGPVSIAADVRIAKLEPKASVRGTLVVPKPQLWSPDNPALYTLRSTLIADGKVLDVHDTRFGIRSAVFTANDGFLLNGRRVHLQGVCEHHDLGPLGSAFYTRAMERKLEILRSMGVNAIRTSHNPPSPVLLDLCDRMGFLVMDEAFDCWAAGKTPNDYSRDFAAWHERDIANLIRRDRNHPSVILWSSGNEIREQFNPSEAEHALARSLTEQIRRHDPTRPVTIGLNNAKGVENGFYKAADLIGINYKPHLYASNHRIAPETPLISSESSSTVSSRGVYYFPVSDKSDGGFGAYQVSSYDLYYPRWAQTPDIEWAAQDKNRFVGGEFVWTGFDYLGEPTPFNDDKTNAFNFQSEAERVRALEEQGKLGGHVPSRSSYFGIVDLCGFLKDRYYLYQARWRPELPMVHLLPHWTWSGRQGEITPVHVYTSGDEVELFLNGRSLGKKKKEAFTYRLVWNEVRYEPGELKAVAFKDGRPWATDVQRTAGKAAKLELTADRTELQADGQDLAYLTVRVLDANGILVPQANQRIRFTITGGGSLIAVCNGDSTDFDSFQGSTIRAFSGMAQGIVKTKRGCAGPITVKIEADALTGAGLVLRSQ